MYHTTYHQSSHEARQNYPMKDSQHISWKYSVKSPIGSLGSEILYVPSPNMCEAFVSNGGSPSVRSFQNPNHRFSMMSIMILHGYSYFLLGKPTFSTMINHGMVYVFSPSPDAVPDQLIGHLPNHLQPYQS